jgi:hypothetical protein
LKYNRPYSEVRSVSYIPAVQDRSLDKCIHVHIRNRSETRSTSVTDRRILSFKKTIR